MELTRPVAATPTWRENRAIDPAELEFQAIKVKLHEQLVESLDLSQLHKFDDARLRNEAKRLAEQLCQQCPEILGSMDRERMRDELLDEMFGLGPLEPLMRDPDVADILVNHAHEVFVERHGRLESTEVIFANNQHLIRIIQRIASRLGRRIDEVSPMVNARLPDGSRVNAVIPPLAVHGPSLSIRRFGVCPLGSKDLIANGTMPEEIVLFLAAAVQARQSCLISGGTGAGKTTLLNALSEFIPANERLVTIEDSAELLLRHKHVVSLETRPANTEGVGAVTQRDLVRNALRMRPDRILVGEVRGPEVWDMLQAMNTGHEGSLTTVHANDTQDALSRLEMMVAMSGFELPLSIVRQYIASSLRLVVQIAHLQGGQRRLVRVSELVGYRDNQYQLEDIFVFDQTGIDARGNAVGQFVATGYHPQCLQKMATAGIEVPAGIFTARRILNDHAPTEIIDTSSVNVTPSGWPSVESTLQATT